MYRNLLLRRNSGWWACALGTSVVGWVLRGAGKTVRGIVDMTPWPLVVISGFHNQDLAVL
jgi:hypothetical protein